jgi:hypothetical protein
MPFKSTCLLWLWYSVTQLAEALCYKPEDCVDFIHLTLPTVGSTQPLTEVSTRDIFWG